MDSLFGAEGSLIVRFVVAFVIVLGLIGLTFWLIRRFGGARVGSGPQKGRQPRLAVIDAAPVDGRRRLVLIRRDNVEHLLMLGGPSDFVVEQNIVRAVPVNQPRDVPVPRMEGARPLADAASALDDEGGWTPPGTPVRPSFPRPEPGARVPRAEPLARAPLPPSIAPRGPEPALRPHEPAPRAYEPVPPPIAPAAEPAGPPDAALANMAQRLEAALRRPGAPEPRSAPLQAAQPAEFTNGEPPPTAPDEPAARPAESGAKSKSVLDSLEEEMASLLGRPPEKPEKQ
jgi:flagellar protein FliO/FliZ